MAARGLARGPPGGRSALRCTRCSAHARHGSLGVDQETVFAGRDPVARDRADLSSRVMPIGERGSPPYSSGSEPYAVRRRVIRSASRSTVLESGAARTAERFRFGMCPCGSSESRTGGKQPRRARRRRRPAPGSVFRPHPAGWERRRRGAAEQGNPPPYRHGQDLPRPRRPDPPGRRGPGGAERNCAASAACPVLDQPCHGWQPHAPAAGEREDDPGTFPQVKPRERWGWRDSNPRPTAWCSAEPMTVSTWAAARVPARMVSSPPALVFPVVVLALAGPLAVMASGWPGARKRAGGSPTPSSSVPTGRNGRPVRRRSDGRAGSRPRAGRRRW